MQQHGFEPVTPVDHRAWLWVVSMLSLTYSALCLGARLIGKWDLLWYDDAVIGVAYAFAVGHWGTIYSAISAGLGASPSILSSHEATSASEHYFTSRILLCFALCVSKLSVVAFTRRIFSGNMYKEKLLFSFAYAAAAIYGLCAVLLSSAGCSPSDALVPQTNAVCNANTPRWAVITTLDVSTEVMLIALPMWLISRNQIKASKKRIVIFVFSFRLIVAAFSIATTATYLGYLGSGRSSIGVAPTVALQEILLGVSLITASIPCLKNFLWAFMSTGLMTAYGVHGMTTSDSQGASNYNRTAQQESRSRSVMDSFHRDEPQQSRSVAARLRPEWLEYKVDVRSQGRDKKKSGTAARGDHASVKSDGSQEMIIHRNVEVEIERS